MDTVSCRDSALAGMPREGSSWPSGGGEVLRSRVLRSMGDGALAGAFALPEVKFEV